MNVYFGGHRTPALTSIPGTSKAGGKARMLPAQLGAETLAVPEGPHRDGSEKGPGLLVAVLVSSHLVVQVKAISV